MSPISIGNRGMSPISIENRVWQIFLIANMSPISIGNRGISPFRLFQLEIGYGKYF